MGARMERGRRDHCLTACAAGGQQIARAAPGADLQQLPAEDVFERLADQLAFGGKQGTARADRPTRQPGRRHDPGCGNCELARCETGNTVNLPVKFPAANT